MNKFAYISIVLAFLAGVGLSSIYFSGLQPEVNINRTEGDVYQTNNIDPPRYNYIQANNHKINYNWQGDGIYVETDKLIFANGLSMRPTIFTGHTLLAREYEGGELKEGVIVSANGITHRIVGDYTDTDGYYLTRGDNNRGSERVEPSEIDSVIIGVLYTKEQN